jgi:heptosyltransferase-3
MKDQALVHQTPVQTDMKPISFLPKSPNKILVIAAQRIGDVLLTTPVLRSLRQAYPDVRIDVVVFKGTEGCISANADLEAVPQV